MDRPPLTEEATRHADGTIRALGDLAAWRLARALPAWPEGQGDAGICPLARPVRRGSSSRRPTAWRKATSDWRGTSNWATRPSRTTRGPAYAKWRPAPAQPRPARN